jgi:hypothetical protein
MHRPLRVGELIFGGSTPTRISASANDEDVLDIGMLKELRPG